MAPPPLVFPYISFFVGGDGGLSDARRWFLIFLLLSSCRVPGSEWYPLSIGPSTCSSWECSASIQLVVNCCCGVFCCLVGGVGGLFN